MPKNTNIYYQSTTITQQLRGRAKEQQPLCIWLTGLSGSGKSSIANELETLLYAAGKHSYILDGDNVRHGLNRDLGFTSDDRTENIRRVAEVAKLMTDAGLIVITSLISPLNSDRAMARALLAPTRFVEVYLKTPLAICEARDPKGLYKKAREGSIINFTGIDSPYEIPLSPEISLSTEGCSIQECAETILRFIAKGG
jgi:adenylyl-sulfate kinase